MIDAANAVCTSPFTITGRYSESGLRDSVLR